MDARKIGDLYLKFGPLIYRRCLKLLADPELSGDACQEVFVRAVRHADRLVSDRECLPWLYRVTTNYCLNLIRDNDKAVMVPLCAEDFLGDNHNLERAAAAGEEVRQLLRCFSDTDAQIALFAFLDRMTQEEIAEVMGISRKTVGKRLRSIAEKARQNRMLLEEVKP
jgi:RNA polymerase sigma-70 factor (ECF subfamily)